MYSYKELRKASKNEVDAKEIKLAILGNCSTQFLSNAVQGFGRLSGLNLYVFDAVYNQIDAELLHDHSEVYAFKPQYVLLWLATEKLYEEFLDMSLSSRTSFAEIYIEKIITYWSLIKEKANAKVLQTNFTELDDKVLGQYSAKVASAFIYQIRKLNFLLQEKMSENGNVYPVDILSVQNKVGYEQFFDAVLYYKAKMTVSTEVLPLVSGAIIDVLKSVTGKIKKCVVLDLDNTLWGGVIGDDGINGIEIGDYRRGHAFTNFQKYLKQLKEYGIILAVCSKNEEHIAKEPFEKHEDMILKLDDISIFIANWDDKVANIRLIQESLNIGMDSIVFIDDNLFERNLVRSMLPDVTVPEMPIDPAEYLTFLQNCNLFDTVSFTGTSSDRTKFYKAEFERQKLAKKFSNIDEYLESLQMSGSMNLFDADHAARIAQLTQRSNQFNLRTVRYTETEILEVIATTEKEGLYFTLKDAYGDHGLVGVLILEIKDSIAFVDTWLMSCRVLKRGMEEFIINQMIDYLTKRGVTEVTAEYLPTAKNQMVKDIYEKMGFVKTSGHTYRLLISDYKPKKVFIIKEEKQ